jgi:hypothetical protein
MTEPRHIESTPPRLDRTRPGSAVVAGTPVGGYLGGEPLTHQHSHHDRAPVPRAGEVNSGH